MLNQIDKKTKIKMILNVTIPQLLIAIYILIFTVLFFTKGQHAPINSNDYILFGYWDFFESTPMPLPAFLSIMFLLELLSTITFQLRMWLTGKDKITTAAMIGSISWLIAGTQAMLLVGGGNSPFQFLIKMLPIGVATYIGIYMNYLIYKSNIFKNKKNETETKSI